MDLLKKYQTWGIPLFMLAIHLVVAIKTENDKSKTTPFGYYKGALFLGRSVGFGHLCSLFLFFKAAGYGPNITKIVLAIVGVLLLLQVIIFPKTSQTVLLDINYRWTKNNPR